MRGLSSERHYSQPVWVTTLAGVSQLRALACWRSLKKHPSRLFPLDEVGVFIQSVTDRKAAEWRKHIWKMHSLSYIHQPAACFVELKTETKGHARELDIQQPCCCVYGVSVPGEFRLRF